MEYEAFTVFNDQQYECGDCKNKCQGVALYYHIKYNKGGQGNCDAKIDFPV